MTDQETFRIAVIIGERYTGVDDNISNILCFLDLFKTPYDIYVCADDDDIKHYKKIRNVKSVIGFSQAIEEHGREELKLARQFMGNAAFQFVKCEFAIRSINDISKYTHMMKIRGDCIFQFNIMICRMFPGQWKLKTITPDRITQHHVEELQKMFKKFLTKVYKHQGVNIHGDKIAIGEKRVMCEWFNSFCNTEHLKTMYKTKHGPDKTAAHKAWKTNKTKTKFIGGVVHRGRSWCPLQFWHLTWYTNEHNTHHSKYNRKLHTGLRGNYKNPVAAWKHIMNYTAAIKKFL